AYQKFEWPACTEIIFRQSRPSVGFSRDRPPKSTVVHRGAGAKTCERRWPRRRGTLNGRRGGPWLSCGSARLAEVAYDGLDQEGCMLQLSRFKATDRVLLIICLMYFITYIDRVNIGTAAPVMQKELGLSNVELGLAFSAF